MAKKYFADVTKLKSLRWRDYPGLSGRALNVITSVLIRGEESDLTPERRRRCDNGSRDWSDVL